MNEETELSKLQKFHAIFSNYFQYWYCESCEVQFESQVGLANPRCPLCDAPSIPWIVAAAREAKKDAKEYESKYNEIVLEKERFFRQLIGIRNICGNFGYVETEETVPQFINRKLEEYEGLLDALPSELRTLFNNGKAKENEKTMSTNSSRSSADGSGSSP